MSDPHYVRTTSVDEAIAALGRAPTDSLIVAGGTVVGSLFNQRLASPTILVDISRIESLRGVHILDGGELRFGALVTHEEVLRSPVVKAAAPLLAEIAEEIACPRLRNRGTLGGSLCTIGGQGDPATGLIALGARLHVRGPAGPRVLALENFYHDAFAVDLRDGELVEAVTVPKMPARAGFGFCKLGPRKAMDWTQITASVVLVRNAAGAIADIRIGMNGVGPTPSRPQRTEAVLCGGSIDWTTVTSTLDEEINPPDDVVYSNKHKRQLAKVAVKRAVERALARTQGIS